MRDRISGVDARNTGRINCPVELGHGYGTFVISDYENPPSRLPPSRAALVLKRAFAKYPEILGPLIDLYLKATEPWLMRRIFG